MILKPSRRRDRLTSDRVERVISVIELWTSKLIQQALTNQVNKDLGTNLTRVGILKNEAIRKAFERRLNMLSTGKPPREIDATTRQWNAKVDALHKQITERDETIRAYKERFIHLHYNAKRLGITVEDLEVPMPSLD